MGCGRESLATNPQRTIVDEGTLTSSAGVERTSSYRWTICALLFVATTINYVDRQVLGVLAPTLQRALKWSEADYGDIVSWFSLAYGFGFLAAGQLIDWFGVKRGLGGSVIAWSVAAIGHAFARTVTGFSGSKDASAWAAVWLRENR